MAWQAESLSGVIKGLLIRNPLVGETRNLLGSRNNLILKKLVEDIAVYFKNNEPVIFTRDTKTTQEETTIPATGKHRTTEIAKQGKRTPSYKDELKMHHRFKRKG